ESSANGSEMGDAIEMRALGKVFAKREGTQGDYKLGSVKANAGHSEAASGMSQLSKVIFSLKHKILVPTLLHGELNPDIQFDRLPFQLQKDVSRWERVTVDGLEVPRRAGITSVGAGGVNAHIIVEEYVPGTKLPAFPKDKTGPLLFILSAKNQDRLEEYAGKWILYLEMNPNADLQQITYTLQVGREAMPSRLAIVSSGQDELLDRLKEWVACPGNNETCYSGDVKTMKVKIRLGVDQTIKTKDVPGIAKLWVLGNEIPWRDLYAGKKLSRVTGLPTYPFKRKQCRVRTGPDNNRKAGETRLDEVPGKYENKAAEFYSLGAKESNGDSREEYLTFCPFPKKIPGF
ncbi:MAG: type I polyketide synthase, partial [bacterium]|nr:type I polyketide synthase [bacterium]